jgi:hypothetical protein
MNNIQVEVANFIADNSRQTILRCHYSEIHKHCINSKHWEKCSRGYLNRTMNLVITRTLNHSFVLRYNY